MSFSKVMSKLSLTRDHDPVEIQERVQGLESYLQVYNIGPEYIMYVDVAFITLTHM